MYTAVIRLSSSPLHSIVVLNMTHILENFIAGRLGTRHPPPPHNNLSEALRLLDHLHDNCPDQEATDDRWVAFIIDRDKLSTEMCETVHWLEKIKLGCTRLIDVIVVSGVKDFDWQAGHHHYWMNRPRDQEEVEYAAIYKQILEQSDSHHK